MSVFGLFFGWPAGAVWGNLAASAICTGIVWWRLHRQAARQHVEAVALAARHHFDRLAQAEDHHRAQLELARRNHQQVMDQAQAHHETLAGRAAAASPGRPRP